MNPNQLPLPLPVQLMMFIVGKWISKPIHAVAELGIPDLLADGPMSIDSLAQESNTHAPTLYRVMRALTGVGIFLESTGKRFQLTPMGQFLKSDGLRSIARMAHADWNDNAWSCFPDSIKTGETAFETAHGMSISQWLTQNPREAEVLYQANAVKAANSHRAIVDSYNFSGIGHLTDVGGGYGALMAEILTNNPSMTGIVADLPPVVRKAGQFIRDRGLADRCQTVACDFFKEIPKGSDAYLMSHILHDWPDEKCSEILANCRKAMEPHSKLLVVEILVPPPNTPSIATLLDLEMLVITGGRERTETEFKSLLTSSGFTFSRVIPTKESVSIIEAIAE